MTERIKYKSYISNLTDQDVTISYVLYKKTYKYHIPSGKEIQIDDNDRYNMFFMPELINTVLFEFSDGGSYKHTCTIVKKDDESYDLEFSPKVNNILAANYAANWTYSSEGKKIRYQYVVKKASE